jgi:hypothetical protein
MGEVVPIKRNQRKTDKEYDYFRELKKKELGEDYPPESNKFNQCWTVEQHSRDLDLRYGKAALEFGLTLKRKVFISPAYRGLSANGRMLYQMCWNETYWNDRQYAKRESARKIKVEGKPCSFYLPYNRCIALGFSSDRAISKAFKELIALQFIERVGQSVRGEANIYKHVDGHRELNKEQVAQIKEELRRKARP